MTVKPQKIKQTTVLPLPTDFRVLATDYDAYQGIDGTIIFTPARPNPFCDAKFVATHHFSQTEQVHLTAADDPF